MPDPIRHPITGEPIELGDGEELQRIAWSGAPVLVITATRPTARCPEGEVVYRLARHGCRIWNPIDGLKLAPWPEPAG